MKGTVRIIAFCATLLLASSALLVAQSDPGSLSPALQRWIESIPHSDGPVFNTTGAFETRFYPANPLTIAAIYDHPTVITDSLNHDNHGELSSIADVEAVYPGKASRFAVAIARLSRYDLLTYRTVFSRDENPTHSMLQYHLQVQAVTTGVLGITETYVFATNNYGQRLSGGAYGFKWNLEGSYRHRFKRMSGSWYIKPVTYKGRQCTYLRYFDHTVFNESPPIPLFILRAATSTDYRQLLMAANHELRTLSREGQ